MNDTTWLAWPLSSSLLPSVSSLSPLHSLSLLELQKALAVLTMSLSLIPPHPHLNNHKVPPILPPPLLTTCYPHWAQSHLQAFTPSVRSNFPLHLHTAFLGSFLPFSLLLLTPKSPLSYPLKRSDALFMHFHNDYTSPMITHIIFVVRLLVTSLFHRESRTLLRQRPYLPCFYCNFHVFHTSP